MTDRLKLIKTPKLKLNEPHTFWNTCHLKAELLPKTACLEGKPIIGKPDGMLKAPNCAWWINSAEHQYCFWKLVRERSNKDGEMPELMQYDIAKLFGWSNAKSHLIFKEAMDELIILLQKHGFTEELGPLQEELMPHNIDLEELTSDPLDF